MPDIANYEANCPELNSFGQPGCGDFQPLGGPLGSNNGGDLTGTAYGSTRTGGAISWIARNKADHGTLWATTSAGRVFVTHSADASDPATVVWHRIDNATSPTRFPSSIYPDPTNVNHAWVTYSGYNAVTPSLPRFWITHLEIEPSARAPTCIGTGKKGCPNLIYAATHSQGMWKLSLGGQ